MPLRKEGLQSVRQAQSKDVSSVIQEPDILSIVRMMNALVTSGFDDAMGGASLSRVSVQG